MNKEEIEKEGNRVMEQIDYGDRLNGKYRSIVRKHWEKMRLKAQEERVANLK